MKTNGDPPQGERRWRLDSVFLATLLFSLLLLVSFAASTGSAANDSWASTASYPTSAGGLSCATSEGYVYCLGDGTNSVYYAPLTSSGVGAWSATVGYPTSISGQSCAASGGYLYCISGVNGTLGPRPTQAVYYAPLSVSGGVAGGWTRTTDYPFGSISLSCAASGGLIYCVGGEETVGTLQTNAVYYASVSSSGVGPWSSTTSYPQTVDAESCVTSTSYLYCIGGYTANGPRPINSTYFALISSSGVGSWAAGADYPTATYAQSCVSMDASVYCIGGGSGTDAVYYSSLSSNGIAGWTSGTSYPTGVAGTSCVSAGTDVYCVAGYGTNAAYYTSATTSTTTSSTSTSSGIVSNNVQWASGTLSTAPYQITLANFSAGAGRAPLLVVGVTAKDHSVNSVTFGGARLTRAVGSFHNTDAEFWSLTNASGTGNIVVTMSGPASVVVGAYSFFGVSQTNPIPTTAAKHSISLSSPTISMTTKYTNSWVLDLPSIHGGVTLGRPSCSQQWNVNMPRAITGASSSKVQASPGSATCKWVASGRGSLWDDVAIEVRAST